MEHPTASHSPDPATGASRYLALCANPIDVVVVLDTDARYRYVSPSVEAVLAYRPEEMVGRLCFDFYHPDDVPRIQDVTAEGIATQEIPRPVIMRVRHKEGHYVWVEATASPVFDPDTGEVVEILGVNRDISDRMRLEHELYAAQRSEIATRLASSATHDLNNLLLVIAALGESLEESVAHDPELKTDARSIYKAALSAGELTRQLLGMIRPASAGTTVFPANEVLEQVALLANRTGRNRCRVEVRADPRQPRLQGDPTRLEQVLLNLALNAAAAGEGREVCITLTSRWVGDRVILTCEDDGRGIDPGILGRIFEPYFTTREGHGGSGIGLSTARRIVESWDGTITVESSPGEGSVFTVSLPAAEPVPTEPPALPVRSGRGVVLVIEPQPAVRHVLQSFLSMSGYAPLCVARPGEARQAFEGAEDVVMIMADDRSAGWEVARELRLEASIPTILMSGSSALPGDMEADEVYLSKPFSSGDLTGAVRRLLGAQAA